MLKINLKDLSAELESGLEILKSELQLELSPDGIPVSVEQGDLLIANLDENGGKVVYNERVSFFRALTHLAHRGIGCDVEERPCFRKNGVMFDASRNSVLTVESLKFFLRRMATMGLNLAMMYTEDTFEVDGKPYFGYLRGRYTKDEQRCLDDYAYALGIEMIPCIQTLAHLERYFIWPEGGKLADTRSVIMVGEDATYDFIETIIKNASEPYRSKRIHIGMDEAWDLGLGQYLNKNGYKSAHELILEHLPRVYQICEKLNLEPMMWSDMHFRSLSPTGDYYDTEVEIPQATIDTAPEGLSLVYWDYYNSDIEVYRDMLRQHARFRAPTIFAGGMWKWIGPVADYEHTIKTTLPALTACREAGIDEIFSTAWGDDGAECSSLSLMYGLMLFAEFGYTGEYNKELLDERFKFWTGADPQAFLSMTRFNEHEKYTKRTHVPPNICKALLYEDPLIPVFEKDGDGFDFEATFSELESEYKRYAAEPGVYKTLFLFHEQLAGVLTLKSRWRASAAKAVRTSNKALALDLVDVSHKLETALLELRETWRELWFSMNKPYGFEVIDIRMGGVIARNQSARLRMLDFAEGRIDTIEELACEKLPVFKEGYIGCAWQWRSTVSTGIV